MNFYIFVLLFCVAAACSGFTTKENCVEGGCAWCDAKQVCVGYPIPTACIFHVEHTGWWDNHWVLVVCIGLAFIGLTMVAAILIVCIITTISCLCNNNNEYETLH